MDIKGIIHKLATDQEITERELAAILRKIIDVTEQEQQKEKQPIPIRPYLAANLN